MATIEFSMNFTNSIPQHFLPNYKQATSAYTQTLNNPPLSIGFRQKKRGEFIISVFNEDDAKKLQDAKVRFEYGPNNKYNAQIKLEKLPDYEFRTNAKFVFIDWIQDSGLRFAKNEDFDEWLGQRVSLISNTTDDRDRDTGFLNGRKKAFVDFNKGQDIPRFEFIEMNVTLPGGSQEIAKGKVKVTYRDQPVSCRTCNVDHIGRCPARAKEEIERKAAEEERARNFI